MLHLLLTPAAEALARSAQLAGVMVLVGAALASWRLAPVLECAEAGAAALARKRLGRLSAATAVIVFAAACMRLVQQSAAMAATPDAWGPTAATILRQTAWGTAWKLQVGSLAVLASTLVGIWRPAWPRLALTTLALVLLASTPALTGHAAGSERLANAAVAFDTLHVLAAGAWLGSLLALVAGVLPSVGSVTPRLLVDLLARFSPLALGSAAVVAVSGAFATWLHLGNLTALLTTTYGRLLLAKLAAVGGVAMLGAYHWRLLAPRLERGDGDTPIRTTMRLEVGLGAIVVLLTSVLVATALPAEM